MLTKRAGPAARRSGDLSRHTQLLPSKVGRMPELVSQPSRVEAAGNKPKIIDEYVGRIASGTTALSVAHMRSPSGWQEPGQTPDFDEFTLVLRGALHVEHRGGLLEVAAGQAVITRKGEWIRYSTPGPEGAEYVAVCMPAFSPETVHRDP
jgi:ethanolamine utilization protein EutQ